MNVNIYLTAGMSFSTMSSRKFISPSLCSAIQTSRIKNTLQGTLKEAVELTLNDIYQSFQGRQSDFYEVVFTAA